MSHKSSESKTESNTSNSFLFSQECDPDETMTSRVHTRRVPNGCALPDGHECPIVQEFGQVQTQETNASSGASTFEHELEQPGNHYMKEVFVTSQRTPGLVQWVWKADPTDVMVEVSCALNWKVGERWMNDEDRRVAVDTSGHMYIYPLAQIAMISQVGPGANSRTRRRE